MPADLTAADITVTVDPAKDIDTSPSGMVGDKWVYPTLAFGDGAKTYPTYGVPLPSPDYFKMNFPVPYRWMNIQQPVNGYLYTYDPTVRTGAPYGTIRIIVISTGAELGHVAVAAVSLNVEVLGK